jgi:hypothetical protein
MPYKKKLIILAVLTGILALTYGFTLFFDPERVNERNASFSWLPGSARDEADRREISSPEGDRVLVRKNDLWFALAGTDFELPVKQGRIDDIFRILTERGAFPLRGSAASSHEGLGLVLGEASRLVIRGGAGAFPLLDLLIGGDDSSGREVFLRKNGENDFRSGERLIATYINGNDIAWYDLRLFHDDPSAMVQRVRVSPLDGTEDFTVAKSGGAGIFEGSSALPDGTKVDDWIRGIFEAQGDSFLPPAEGGELAAGRITLELGDGSVRTILAGEVFPDGDTERRPVSVSGVPHLFVVSQWTLQNRLFRTREVLQTSN